jgi:hypothetical protein
MNYTELLDAFLGAECDLVYFDRPGRSNPQMEVFRTTLEAVGRQPFSIGAFLARRTSFSLADCRAIAADVIQRSIAIPRNLSEMGFLIWAAAEKRITDVPGWELVPDLKRHTWAGGNRDQFLNAFRTGRDQGQRFPFVHWSGWDVNPAIPLPEIYLHFRLWRAPLRERARVEYSWRVKPPLRRIKQRLFGRNKK